MSTSSAKRSRHQASASGTGALPSPASAPLPNVFSLDKAPRIPLKPGSEGRYGLCDLSALLPNPHAVRVHPKRQIDKLAHSFEISGLLSPVIIDETYTILAGHGRLAAAKQSGSATLPVIQVFGLSEAEKRAYLLSDNRIGEDARLDREKFALQISELVTLFEEAGFELSDTGFEVAEIDTLVIDFEEDASEADDDLHAALSDEPVLLRSGDVFEMGPHRLGVGDARDPALLDEVTAGEKAKAAFLDVPYNVAVAGIVGRGRVKHPEFAFASGEMTRTEFVAFLTTALQNAVRVSLPGAVHFVCIDWKHVRDLIEAGEAVYGAYLNLIVWNKTNAGQGGLYRNQHELIGVFRVGEERHLDNVQQGRLGRNRSNVWTYAGVNTFRAGRLEDLAAHPTVKPTQLVADALKDVTRRGDLVLDTFVGSGTTILAGEKVGRRVRAIEIEPRYAQIAIRRWQALTGRTAVHIETGLSFEALLQQRAEPEPSLPLKPIELPPVEPQSVPPLTSPPARARVRRRIPAS